MMSNLEMAIDYAVKHIELALEGQPGSWLLAEVWMKNAAFMMTEGSAS